MLPSFCNYPVDTAESFADLGRILCGALQSQAETRGIICASLNILIQQNKEVVEGKEIPVSDASPAMVRASARYNSDIAAANLKVLRSCAPKLLDVLSRIFHESGKDDGGSLQVTNNSKWLVTRLSVNGGIHQKKYYLLEYNILVVFHSVCDRELGVHCGEKDCFKATFQDTARAFRGY